MFYSITFPTENKKTNFFYHFSSAVVKEWKREREFYFFENQ